MLLNYGISSVVKDIYGEAFPFLLLLPCTHASSWTVGSVPKTLINLIDYVCEEYEADHQRISITGHSLGSSGVWKMISLYGNYFSAAVPVSCGIDGIVDHTMCAEVPINAFAGNVGGDERNFGPAMQKLIDRINDVGGNAKMSIIDGADHDAMVTAAYTLDLFEWILAQ